VPTYSYACTACEHHFDIVQKFTDPSLTDCPECSGRLRKLFSPVGIVFKGSGFYRTDSRSSSAANGKSESSAPDKSSDKTGDKPKTSESKPSSDTKTSSAKASKVSAPAA
jgi:putative FmdB family regulatory protein